MSDRLKDLFDDDPTRAQKVELGAVHPSESNAATAEARPATIPSLAALLVGHVLRDGELVLLILKPSVWYVAVSSLRFIAVVATAVLAAKLYQDRLPESATLIFQAGVFLVAGRLMWAVLQWMGRLYILTDMRIIRLSGVFGIDIYDVPLRRIARTRLVYTTQERLLRLGSIEIIPQDEDLPIGSWQTIARPRQVHKQVIAAINRARRTCEW